MGRVKSKSRGVWPSIQWVQGQTLFGFGPGWLDDGRGAKELVAAIVAVEPEGEESAGEIFAGDKGFLAAVFSKHGAEAGLVNEFFAVAFFKGICGKNDFDELIF